ncbi:MAG: hypothetical protein IJS45_08860 [Clostridia bacterium]|nr:hypothetical protein [Clostridia bacterium]
MSATGRVIKVTDFEHRLMINCLRKARNEYIEQGMPTEDVSKLMVKVMEAPAKKQRSENEAR